MLFSRLLKEGVLFAIGSLVNNKLRTFLSLLGITIGIFSIISVFTIVDSLENSLRGSIASLGDNVIFVQKWPWEFGDKDFPWWKYMNRPSAKMEDNRVIEHRSDNALASAFVSSEKKIIKYESNSAENVEVVSVSHDYYQVKNLDIEFGRYFSESESAGGKDVAIIGSEIADALFAIENPLGKEIKVGGRNAKVIGVFKREGESMLGGSMDNQVVLPEAFAKGIIDETDATLMVKAKEGISNEELKDELRGILRSSHKLKPITEDDFALNETSLLSKQFDGLFGIFHLAGWIIGGFSMLVGGFGIANIMFVSVRERTSIIGIQKSLGAKRYFILLQFLLESILLSLIGAFLGLLIIYLGTFFAKDVFDMEVTLSFSNVLLALSMSIVIGIVSGLAPAYSAAKLDPVEAIRSN